MASSRISVGLRVIRIGAVKCKVGLSRSSIYGKMASGEFPTPVPLGANSRAVGWIESEIDQWIIEQIARSRKEV